MKKTLALAKITFKEGIRNRSLFGIALLALFLFGLNITVAGFFMRDIGKVTVDMNLSALSFAGLLLVFFVGINLMAKDIDRKTIHLVLSKPISRAQYIFGKYLGIQFFVSVSLLLLFMFSCLTVGLLLSFYPEYFFDFSWQVFITAFFFILVKFAVLTSIVVFFSAITTSSLITLIFSFSSYVIGITIEEVVFYLKSEFAAQEQIISDSLKTFIDIVSYVVPNFSVFDLTLEAAHGLALGGGTALAVFGVWCDLYLHTAVVGFLHLLTAGIQLMRRVLPVILVLSVLGLYGLLSQGVWSVREQVRAETPAGYIIPSKFSRILAFGNQGLVSDYLFLKVATFVGGRIGAKSSLSEEDWTYVFKSLDVVTDLDPYFVDPYLLAEGLLAWEAGQPEKANQLLMKGMEYRTSDWRLPFFAGFNSFYFLKDFETASDLIMKASKLPGSPAYLATLGARLAYYGGKSKTALLFLKEMLQSTDDQLLKSRLETRMLALEGAVVIEEALESFKAVHGRLPDSLEELVFTGFIVVLPVEPYGGDWLFNKSGRVFSTSRFASTYQEELLKETPSSK